MITCLQKFSIKSLLAVVCIGALLVPSSAVAQTCSNTTGLRTCNAMNVISCRDSFSCSSDRREGLTPTDAALDYLDTCCGLTGKKLRKCKKRLKRKYRGKGGILRSFGRESGKAIEQVACATDTKGTIIG